MWKARAAAARPGGRFFSRLTCKQYSGAGAGHDKTESHQDCVKQRPWCTRRPDLPAPCIAGDDHVHQRGLVEVRGDFKSPSCSIIRDSEKLRVRATGQDDHQTTKTFRERIEKQGMGHAVGQELIRRAERRASITGGDAVHQFAEQAFIRKTEDLREDRGIQHAVGGRDDAVEERQGIPHRAIGESGDLECDFGRGLDPLAGENAGEVFGDRGIRDRPEIEPLTTTLNGLRNLLGFGGAEHELHMIRRLLHDLEQSVERLGAQHVDLVDDVELVGHSRRHQTRIGDQFANLVHSIVTGAVDLDDIDVLTTKDRIDGILREASLSTKGGSVVHQFAGEDSRGRGLAHTSGSTEEIGVRGALGFDGVSKRPDDGLLADKLVERFRTVSTGEDLIGTGF